MDAEPARVEGCMIQKYDARSTAANTLLCIGLDADIEKIPERFKELEHPQFEFNKYIIDATHEFAAAYKPNTAFYEARGEAGLAELKMTMYYLEDKYPDIYTILDAKRADIGNTNNGYVTFAFDWLGADAITVHPYLGKEALAPFLNRADRTTIILCRTSNPGSGEVQDLVSDGKPLWHHVAEKVQSEWNGNNNCMLVVGATYPKEMKTIRACVGDMTLLVPGIGAQGGDVKAVVQNGMNAKGRGLIISASRSIIFAENPAEEARKLRDEINACR